MLNLACQRQATPAICSPTTSKATHPALPFVWPCRALQDAQGRARAIKSMLYKAMAIHAAPMGCVRPHFRNVGPGRSARNAPVQREGDQPQGCQPRMGACGTHRTRPDPSTNNQRAHSSHAACRLLSHEPARTSSCARARSLADSVTLAAGRWGQQAPTT